MLTSRGCPHHCSFCSVHQTFGKAYQTRSAEAIIAEIKMRVEAWYKVIDFEDDNPSYIKKNFKELCRAIIHEFAGRDLELLAMKGMSFMSLDEELLGLMKKAGFTHLNISLVSTDDEQLKNVKRPHDLDLYKETILQAADLGLKTVSYQILGLPKDNLDNMVSTQVMMAKLPVLMGASPFYLTPNAPIAKEMGFYHSEADTIKSRLTAMAIESNNFSRDDIYTLFVTTRVINFIKTLPVDEFEEHVTINDVLKAEGLLRPIDERVKIGLDLLKDLLTQGVLYAATPEGKKPLTKFKYSLFKRVWDSLSFIMTQEQFKIHLK